MCVSMASPGCGRVGIDPMNREAMLRFPNAARLRRMSRRARVSAENSAQRPGPASRSGLGPHSVTPFPGADDGLRTRFRAELGEDARHHVTYGLLAEIQLCGDRVVFHAAGEEFQQVGLARRELGETGAHLCLRAQ